MSKEREYQELYDRLRDEVSTLHENNRRRIRIGMRMLLAVTLGLMLLMFLAEGNKVFTLILWILSMFALSAYLIGVEYMDYELQKKLQDITQEEQATLGQLIALPQLSRTARLPQLLKWKGEEQAEEETQAAEPAPAKSESRAVTLPMPEENARPVVDGPVSIPLDMDAILKSDPQKMAADLAQLAQALQALSADLAAGGEKTSDSKEVGQ